MKFKDEKNANEYFRNYYQGSKEEDGETVSNKDQLDERAKPYVSTVDNTNMKFSSELFLVAGNVIQNYYAAGGSSMQSDNYFDNANKILYIWVSNLKLYYHEKETATQQRDRFYLG